MKIGNCPLDLTTEKSLVPLSPIKRQSVSQLPLDLAWPCEQKVLSEAALFPKQGHKMSLWLLSFLGLFLSGTSYCAARKSRQSHGENQGTGPIARNSGHANKARWDTPATQ